MYFSLVQDDLDDEPLPYIYDQPTHDEEDCSEAGHDHSHSHSRSHSHSHSHAHAHEGHSHNMRGVFLHVMAVSYPNNSVEYISLIFFAVCRIPSGRLGLSSRRYLSNFMVGQDSTL